MQRHSQAGKCKRAQQTSLWPRRPKHRTSRAAAGSKPGGSHTRLPSYWLRLVSCCADHLRHSAMAAAARASKRGGPAAAAAVRQKAKAAAAICGRCGEALAGSEPVTTHQNHCEAWGGVLSAEGVTSTARELGRGRHALRTPWERWRDSPIAHQPAILPLGDPAGGCMTWTCAAGSAAISAATHPDCLRINPSNTSQVTQAPK